MQFIIMYEQQNYYHYYYICHKILSENYPFWAKRATAKAIVKKKISFSIIWAKKPQHKLYLRKTFLSF